MRIGVVSDVHCMKENREECLETLEDVLSELEDANVVVFLGDMITDEDAELDRELTADVAERAKEFDVPVRAVIGNHDTENQTAEEVLSLFGNSSYGREVVEGQELFFLDSSPEDLAGARGEISEDQLSFLSETLPSVDDAIVFVHHPLHYQDIRDNPWFGEYPERAFCGNKKEVNEIFDNYGGIRAVFNGHLHEQNHTLYRGIDHVTLPPFAREHPENVENVTGKHAVVEVEEDIRVKIRTPDEKIAEYVF